MVSCPEDRVASGSAWRDSQGWRRCSGQSGTICSVKMAPEVLHRGSAGMGTGQGPSSSLPRSLQGMEATPRPTGGLRRQIKN